MGDLVALSDLCTCSQQIKNNPTHVSRYPVTEMERLATFCWKLWMLAHVEPTSQRILRDIGSISDWIVHPTIRQALRSYAMSERESSNYVETLPLMECIAMRLAGRQIRVTNKN